MRLVPLILLGILCFAPHQGQAQGCLRLDLDSTFVIGDIPGDAPPEGFICYDLSFPRGQNMSIELASGRNVSISVPGYYDARNDRQFLGDLPGHLEIRVFQLLRSARPEPFLVRLRSEPPGNG